MTTPRKDYLKYLKELTNEQYSFYDDEEETEKDTADNSWVWAEPPAKEKMKIIVFNGVVDATELRKDQIKESLGKAKNIKVGEFTLRIRDVYGRDPLEKGVLSLEVYEKRTKTPTGQPCNMDYRCDLSKDKRFASRPWLSYFKGSWGRDVPIDTIIDIVRWMQALKRLTVFL